MRHGGQSVLALDSIRKHQGFVPSAAPGTVGYGTKIWLERFEGGNGSFEQRVISLLGFGWKKLERNHQAIRDPFGGMDVPNELHDGKGSSNWSEAQAINRYQSEVAFKLRAALERGPMGSVS